MTTTLAKSALEAGLFSADSHVMEPFEVFDDALPRSFWQGLSSNVLGGTVPEARTEEMLRDGVVAEVLYPTLGLRVFGVEDPATQEAALHAYNVWLAQFCATAPERLLGIGLIPAYDTDVALAEIDWCLKAGFRGIMIWQVPHPDLPLNSHHYDPIWQAAVTNHLPVSLHILSGFPYDVARRSGGVFSDPHGNDPARPGEFDQLGRLKRTVNLKLYAAMDSTVELVLGGVFERYPELVTVIVENEIGWLPFAATQWDYFCQKVGTSKGKEQDESPISKMPSDYIGTNVYATFFRDVLSANIFQSFGEDTFMWSNDFPHHNSTWPNSREFITTQLASCSEETLLKVLRTNAERLYGPAPRF